jgi:hypothetical protein
MIENKTAECGSNNNATKMDAIMAQKLALRELERSFTEEDRRDRQRLLAHARAMAADNDAIQSVLTWLEAFLPLGAHPTFIVQAWSSWQYRLAGTQVNQDWTSM